MSDIDGMILEIQDDVRNICDNCGKCCKGELFYLSDIEAPVIALKLMDQGGVDLIKKHIFWNPYEFNIFGRYLYKFDASCPFHVDNRCLIYNDRPMTCRLFPLALGGIFDNTNMELRDPFFLPTQGKATYDCNTDCRKTISQLNELGRIHPQLSKTAVNLIASALLDKKNLGYCFGQARMRGKEFIDTTGRVFINENEVMGFLVKKLAAVYGKTIAKVVDHKQVLTKNQALDLASENRAKKQTRKTSKRLARIRIHHPSILEWHKRYSK